MIGSVTCDIGLPMSHAGSSSVLDASGTDKGPPRETAIHPLYVRITHWINALALLSMIGSGWQIYNASPLFGFTFPGSLTLGGWLAGALLWHLAAMWLLIANGLVYLVLGWRRAVCGASCWRSGRAKSPRDVGAALTGRLAHDDLTHYNAVQKALYVGVLLAGVVIVASGLACGSPCSCRS